VLNWSRGQRCGPLQVLPRQCTCDPPSFISQLFLYLVGLGFELGASCLQVYCLSHSSSPFALAVLFGGEGQGQGRS
jgi:hypothetical protein